jgi:hypothetical protein
MNKETTGLPELSLVDDSNDSVITATVGLSSALDNSVDSRLISGWSQAIAQSANAAELINHVIDSAFSMSGAALLFDALEKYRR